jgi:serine/threonine protein kinase
LRDLLLKILKVKASERISMEEVSNHYFFSSYESEETNEIIHNKINSFHRFLYFYKQKEQTKLKEMKMVIRRNNLVEDVIKKFSEFKEADVFRKIFIEFKGYRRFLNNR